MKQLFHIILLSIMLSAPAVALGQRRLLSREEMEQIANPALAKGSEALHFEQERVLLGDISEDGGVVSGSFRFTNQGPEPIVVVRATTDCGCLKVQYPHSPIKPGKSGELEFSYSPKGYPGKLHRKILLYTNLSDSEPSAKLEVVGFVESSSDMSERYPFARGAALLKSQSVIFSRNAEHAVERVVAYNNTDRELSVKALSGMLPQGISLHTEPAVVAARSEFEIVISYDASLWSGAHKSFDLILDGVESSPRNSIIEINFR